MDIYRVESQSLSWALMVQYCSTVPAYCKTTTIQYYRHMCFALKLIKSYGCLKVSQFLLLNLQYCFSIDIVLKDLPLSLVEANILKNLSQRRACNGLFSEFAFSVRTENSLLTWRVHPVCSAVSCRINNWKKNHNRNGFVNGIINQMKENDGRPV